MVSKNVILDIKDIIGPFMNENKYEICDIEFAKEGPNWYLRIFADKEGGISIDDCEIISRKVDILIEEKDLIEQAYILEVSSPGIDRPLKNEADYIKYKGKVIDIKLYKAIEKQKEFQGTLIGLINNVVTIEDEEGQSFEFELKEIASCRLAVIF